MRASLLALFVACAGTTAPALFEDELQEQVRSTGLRDAIPVVSVVGDAYWPAPSPDGRTLAFTSVQGGNTDVWRKDFVTGAVLRLTEHSAEDEDPAISPDGKTIAFISHRDDAKGDVFLMNINGDDERRLTTSATSERAPAWALDGKSLFVASRPNPAATEDVYRLDLETKALTQISKGGGFDASVHKSGNYICYSQPQLDAKGKTFSRIMALRLSDGKAVPVSDGRRPEAFCRFGGDWVYFTRYVEDDNRDERFDTLDVPAIYRVAFDAAVFDKTAKTTDLSEPVTSGFSWETLSAPLGDRIFFVANGTAGLEIHTLPADGLSPKSMSNAAIMALAEQDIPARMRRYFFRVVMARGGEEGQVARYQLARDFAAEDRLEDAQGQLKNLVELNNATASLAKMETIRNQFFIDFRERREDALDLSELKTKLDAVPAQSPLVAARKQVVLAEASELMGNYAQSLDFAHAVPRTGSETGEDAARAERIENAVATMALPEEEEQRRLLAFMRARPKQTREVRAARDRFLKLLPPDPLERLNRLRVLMPLAQDMKPLYVQLALSKADALTNVGQTKLAVEELSRVRDDKALTPNDLGRVLFALGRAQEARDDLTAALQSFDAMARGATLNRVQRLRGRAEIMRLALKKARAEEAIGDTRAAYESYRTLAAANEQEAFAHRKVLQLGNTLGLSEALDDEYRARVKAAPYEATSQYAAALAATYVGDLERARAGFEKAIGLNSGLGYAHLGLGWVYEQYEYQSPLSSDALERALHSYNTARAVFEAARDQDAFAEAALNIANAFSRIGQFDQAFANYLQRDKASTPFQSKTQQILFHERFGQAAIRTGEEDVALMTLKEGIRLAEAEGDDRRLGRMRALQALAYDGLGMRAESRQALIRARDEYATRNDFDRVVALDRTIGYMWLETGDEREASEALERSLALLSKGFGPKGAGGGLITLLIPIDALDASRAPQGFSRDDENEVLGTLLARVRSRVGDTMAADTYLEERRKRIAARIGDGYGKFMLPELFAASRELMELALRRQDFARVAQIFVELAPRYLGEEKRKVEWIFDPVRLLWRLPFSLLPSELLAQTLDELEKLKADPGTGAEGAVDRLRRQAGEVRERARALVAEASAPTGDPTALWKALDVAPASQPVAQAASQPVERGRRSASRHVIRDLDAAERAFVAGDFVEGERLLAAAKALAKRFSLFDADWQIEYLRFRLGPFEQRSQALDAAERALVTADAMARLLWPQRARPAAWGGLLSALLHRAIERKDANAYVRALERRTTLPNVVLPEGYTRAEDGDGERGRQKLQAWANEARKLIAANEPKTDPEEEKALAAHFAAGEKLIKDMPDPWRSLLLCEVDAKRLRAVIGPQTGFVWDKVSLGDDHFVWGASGPVTYAVGAGPSHVASANALWLAAAARNIDNADPVEIGPVVVTAADAATPANALKLSGEKARTDELLLAGGTHGLARFVLDADLVEGAPGVARFKLVGDSSFTSELTSLQLPALGLTANLVVIDGLKSLQRPLLDALSTALALAGTPSVLFCAGTAHASLLKAFYDTRQKERALDAWTRLAKQSPAGSECEYWGFASDDDTSRIAFAQKQMDAIPAKTKVSASAKRWRETRELYETGLRYARFLNNAEKQLEFLAGIATSSGLLEDYDKAIAYQELVVKAAQKPKEKGEALILLGALYSRAKNYEVAAQRLREGGEIMKPLAIARFGYANMQEAAAWRAAARYDESARAYRTAAQVFADMKSDGLRLQAVRSLAVVTESNLSEFAEAQKLFDEARTIARKLISDAQKLPQTDEKQQKAAKDALSSAESALSLARIDYARVTRMLGELDVALRELRGLLQDLSEKDFVRRSEATLEVARVYWYQSDYERALITVAEAQSLAEKGRAQDESRSLFLRIQALSFEGVILKDQGKRVAASNRLRRALRLARITNRRSEESVQLNNLGLVMRERALYDQAVRLIAKAVAIDTDMKAKDGLTVDLRNLGIVRLRQRRFDEAKTLLAQAEQLNKEAGTRANGLQIALAQGEIALEEKALPAAQKSFELAIKEAVALRSRDLEWRARFGLGLADPKRARVEKEKALAVIESLGPQREEARANLLAASRLRESLARTYLDSGEMTALWELLERIRLKELRDQVPGDVWSKRLSLSVDDATDFAKLQAAARARNEVALVPLFSLKPASLAEVQAAQADRNVVVLRAFDDGVLAMVNGQARYLPQKKSELLDALNAWDASLRALQPAGSASAPLFNVIAQALQPALNGKPLLILGDGLFNRLPWAAVPIGSRKLVELARIQLDLSGTHAMQKTTEKPLPGLIAVGPTAADALPYARMETDDSVASFAEQGRTSKWLTLREFSGARKDAQLWHVAVHGDSYGKELRGAFLHSGEDATLYATELLQAHQHVQTAVISACEVRGEEPNGVALVSALRLSGAARVLAPVSRVYDDLTATFVKRIMRSLAQDPQSDPLRQLQIDALRAGEPEAAWATFIETGSLN